MWNSFIRRIDKTILGASALDQSVRGSEGNEGVLHISLSSRITEAAPSDCLVRYKGHSVGGLTLCRDTVRMHCIPR